MKDTQEVRSPQVVSPLDEQEISLGDEIAGLDRNRVVVRRVDRPEGGLELESSEEAPLAVLLVTTIAVHTLGTSTTKSNEHPNTLAKGLMDVLFLRNAGGRSSRASTGQGRHEQEPTPPPQAARSRPRQGHLTRKSQADEEPGERGGKHENPQEEDGTRPPFEPKGGSG